jgi:hypothetical protein
MDLINVTQNEDWLLVLGNTGTIVFHVMLGNSSATAGLMASQGHSSMELVRAK